MKTDICIEDFVKEIPFLQTKNWAVINALFNNAKKFIITDDIKDPTILAQFFYTNTDLVIKRIVKNILNYPAGCFVCYSGPVFKKTPSLYQLENFVINLNNYCKKLNIASLTINTSILVNYEDLLELNNLLIFKGFKSKKVCTNVVDLTPNIEDIFMSFKNAARTGYRKALDLGVQFKRCQNFKEYFEVFQTNISIIKNMEMKSFEKHKIFWDQLSDNYNFFYSTTSEGKILSLLGTYAYNGIVTPISSMITPFGIESKIPSQDLVFWEVMKFHKNAKDTLFELTHFDLSDDISEKEKGIRRFKLKWSGTLIESFVFEKTYIKNKSYNT